MPGWRDIRVLWGRCYEGDGAPPFWPWAQVIRAAVRGQEPDALLAELGSAAADIAALVPAVRERLPACRSRPRSSLPRRASVSSTASPRS